LNFSVGITVYREYGLLVNCLEAVHKSYQKPYRIYILDNGRQFQDDQDDQDADDRDGYFVITPPNNIGVASAWNILLSLIHPLTAIILNDDCIVKPDTFGKLMSAPPGIAIALGHACFRQDHIATSVIGPYDENYWPAYYEDADYRMRAKEKLVQWTDLGNIVEGHGHNKAAPYQFMDVDELAYFKACVESNKQRFIKKWGGLPSKFF